MDLSLFSQQMTQQERDQYRRDNAVLLAKVYDDHESTLTMIAKMLDDLNPLAKAMEEVRAQQKKTTQLIDKAIRLNRSAADIYSDTIKHLRKLARDASRLVIFGLHGLAKQFVIRAWQTVIRYIKRTPEILTYPSIAVKSLTQAPNAPATVPAIQR
jgi:hypothetical protein